MMKKFVTILLALVLAFSAVLPVSAAQGDVTYYGGAEQFVFTPGSDHSPTDLFPDFKDVMPGDTLTQTITVKNDDNQYTRIDLYLRALGAQEDSGEFLSQLQLQVKRSGDSTGEYLFNAAADETAQLSDWVCLGTFFPGSEVQLDVTLMVPVTLDRQYQNAIGKLDWEFNAREFPIGTGDGSGDGSHTGKDNPHDGTGTGSGTDSAETGDHFPMGVWAALVVCSGAAMTAVLCRRKRENP